MARHPIAPDDSSPLDGGLPQVGARIGWLLQVNRLEGHRTLREVADGLTSLGVACHSSTLSRIEQAGTGEPALIRGYEVVLGLTPGSLSAAIDILARTFPEAHDLRERETRSRLDPYVFEQRVAAVTADRPTGADWLSFAREHQADVPFGLPPGQMRPLVDRLLSEMLRGVGFAFTTRYDALTRLRTGLYARVVFEGIRELIEAPYVPFSGALLGVLGESADEATFAWCLGLLTSHDADRVRAARLCLVTFIVLGTMPEAWARRLVPQLVHAARSVEPDSAIAAELGRLRQALPRPWREAYARSGGPALPLMRRPEGWSRTRANRHFGVAEWVAHTLTAAHGMADHPLLARLLFEVLFDPRPERVVTSGYLLMASPFAPDIHAELVRLAIDGDEVTKAGARSAVVYVHRADISPTVEPWLASDDHDLRVAAGVLAGVAGEGLDERLIVEWSAHPGLHGHAVVAAGMAQLPVLDRLPDTPGPAAPESPHGAGLRPGQAAQWWRRHGGVVRE